MPTRRVLKSALRGCLGTYASRYSDFNGYWLFGFLVDELSRVEFNLLERTRADATDPRQKAQALAAIRFSEQLAKAGLLPSQVSSAQLCVERLPGTSAGAINGHPSSGFTVRFSATATAGTGRRYVCEQLVFVAAHNPEIELRSGRADNDSGAAELRD